ncbi:MAG: quinolinate synthase NadA [Thermoguttaceae bacterium]|jgi:quinolinate synthase
MTSLGAALEAYKQLDRPALAARVREVRRRLGRELLILGHHYQQDEVVAQSDLQGDSYQLSAQAAADQQCRWIVFCGVHFMAETADILANRPEQVERRGGSRVTVVLPDLTAGCSMADMAEIGQVEDCWEQLAEVIEVADVMPVTYVNSAAALKAFCGRRGGIVCTSANARAVLEWSFQRRRRVLFFPDQHLGRNTARRMGVALEEMPVWDPRREPLGGNSPEAVRRSRVLLWQGHCSVHQMFLPQHVAHFRATVPGIRILVHPECMMEVVDQADVIGSTGRIIRAVEEAPPGTRWAIGTELHLVERLKQRHPEQEIHFLSPVVCMCSTMYRIDLPHLCWALENLAAGAPVNVVRVDDETAAGALLALQRMLEVK